MNFFSSFVLVFALRARTLKKKNDLCMWTGLVLVGWIMQDM